MKRREFLYSCGAASLLGISVASSNESIAGILRKNKLFPFCSVREQSNPIAALGREKWGRKHFRYFMAGRDTGELDAEVWDRQFRLSFDAWSEVTPLTFEQVGRTDEHDIVISVGGRRKENFGKRGGVLAWAQLPPTRNFDGTLLSKFDLAENWVLPESKEAGIILRSVATHEIGHLLGLHHSADPDALMFPYVNDALKPRSDDIAKIQRLYGKP